MAACSEIPQKSRRKSQKTEKHTQNPLEFGDDAEVTVSAFDYSIDNHFKAVDMISRVCGEPEVDASADATEIQRISSTITFVREWRDYKYEPVTIRFSSETGSPQGQDKTDGISLPQFSAATVPQKQGVPSESKCPKSRNDFVLYVGGLVWAMDWCPRDYGCSESQIKCEFIAVSAHPPNSSYHLIGAPLSGTGFIQIWCLVNANLNGECVPPKVEKTKGRSRKNDDATKPRGRPRKKPNNDSIPEKSLIQPKRHRGRPRKNPKDEESLEDSQLLLTYNEHKESSFTHLPTEKMLVQEDSVLSSMKAASNSPLEIDPTSFSVPTDISLPRIILGLAHDGEVAWDVKWQPQSDCKHRMGHLAALLGNGSLEVWEVPYPSLIKVIYSSCHEEGTDPRFLKLEPVFRCSKLKCGDRQSIPLALEWSASAPHDFILVGCHDGTVALWKFSPSSSQKDTRPLLTFYADTMPIRAVGWAPVESGSDGANLIVTAAGHGAVKFWDLRDPFRPLWDFNPAQRGICSLDWLQDPRCVLLSFDDGTLRILSLARAADDFPVTGKPFDPNNKEKKHQGLSCHYCTPFTIWSVHVSRLTGMAAYCCSEGTTFRFPVTMKAVDKFSSRYRAPQFLCGSLTVEDSVITINTPFPNRPVPTQKLKNYNTGNPKTMGDFLPGSDNVKKANKETEEDQILDDQTLALGWGDDLEMENALVTPNKAEPSGKEEVKSFDVFPPKAVAMHRVRWNTNKGSEKWLCYGGAAGLLRCQQINFADSV